MIETANKSKKKLQKSKDANINIIKIKKIEKKNQTRKILKTKFRSKKTWQKKIVN